MKQLKIWILAACLFIGGILLGGYVVYHHFRHHIPLIKKATNLEAEYIPQAPDYDDVKMWMTVDDDNNGQGADIFYVVSTWEEDWTAADGRTCHYADVWDLEHREHMKALEMDKVAAYMSPGNHFFAPFYRHTTIDAWLTQNEDTLNHRLVLPMKDVCTAFDHFIAHRDQTRPIILAGFSQGGRAVVDLLKHMSEDAAKRMITILRETDQVEIIVGTKINDDVDDPAMAAKIGLRFPTVDEIRRALIKNYFKECEVTYL